MLIRAAWVVPVSSPPIRDGHVRVADGRIADVGAWSPGRATGGDSVVELGNVALLPGFVNCHTHLELTGYAGKLPPAPLWDWLDALFPLRRMPGAVEAEADAVRRGAAMSLAAGVTCVGDISRNGASFAGMLESRIRKVCFFELISGAGMPPRDPDELRATADAFAELAGSRDNLTIGFSPHAPYTVSWNDLRRVAALAGERDAPITMHFCETPEERQWLEARQGKLVEFLSKFPAFAAMQMPQGPPMSVLHRAGMTRLRPLLAHVNYATDEEIADLARAGCSVAFCPRAHRYYGHSGHRWREMLAAGVNVCAATDSMASSGTLSVLDELRHLRRVAPEMSAEALLAMGTVNPAHALGLGEECGAIRPGMWGDLTAVPLEDSASADPVADVLNSGAMPMRTWVAGM